MQIIIHRVNTIEQLKTVLPEYGVEIDVRGYGDKILLNHEPIDNPDNYDELDDYLQNFNHSFIVFNIKEAGYEQKVIDLVKKHGIKDYFLLDVEFPYFYKATRMLKNKNLAVRYSEAEPIEYVEAQMDDKIPLVDWVWIDTNTKLPIDKDIADRLKPFKTCLVCPSRWGRPEDINNYIAQMKRANFKPDAVMTSDELAPLWKDF